MVAKTASLKHVKLARHFLDRLKIFKATEIASYGLRGPTCHLCKCPLNEDRAAGDFPKSNALHARLIQSPLGEAVHKLCSVNLQMLSA